VTAPRLIPVLLLREGQLVRSQRFRVHQAIGNPVSSILRFSNWNVDELVLLDIGARDDHDLRRDDLAVRYGATLLDVLAAVAPVCVMPLAVGGRIRTLQDIQARLSAGADKCVINTAAFEDRGLVAAAARRFGSQAVVVSIDAARRPDGRHEVLIRGGAVATGIEAAAWARDVERAGAGEILLNSIERDGSGLGYDLDLLRSVTSVTSIPVIACGGVGRYEHLAAGVIEGGADGVAAANIFHFFELSYPWAKRACLERGVAMRPVGLGSRWLRREPAYPPPAARRVEPPAPSPRPPRPMRWCTRCVYPALAAAPMEFDEDGVCMGCRMAQVKRGISAGEWARRRELLRELLERARSRDGGRYDCIIPVSGGKDSYFQTHVIVKELGLRPLLVTYNGNNYTEAGWRNVHRMKEVFDVDHLFYSPAAGLLRRLNRLAFRIMGDMNWHAHVGITTLPVRAAVAERVPLVIWGEHGYLDLCGQFAMEDFPEMSYRDRLEHFARGYEWSYFVGLDGITAAQMLPWRYPEDQAIFDLDLRGIYLGNYVPWEANDHGPRMRELYGWEQSPEPFDRTYRRMSNLDDMHENGVHDYLKYIKFGYGRCTDHACKDIRAGRLTRAEAIDLVRRYDHVRPRDLARWLEYTGMSEAEFDAIADRFRDPRVWWREGGRWVRHTLWEEAPRGPEGPARCDGGTGLETRTGAGHATGPGAGQGVGPEGGPADPSRAAALVTEA
jgi:imidazoleglycerol phosphate synthase cyclase subunit